LVTLGGLLQALEGSVGVPARAVDLSCLRLQSLVVQDQRDVTGEGELLAFVLLCGDFLNVELKGFLGIGVFDEFLLEGLLQFRQCWWGVLQVADEVNGLLVELLLFVAGFS
jgi:hypothetical protein